MHIPTSVPSQIRKEESSQNAIYLSNRLDKLLEGMDEKEAERIADKFARTSRKLSGFASKLERSQRKREREEKALKEQEILEKWKDIEELDEMEDSFEELE